MNYLWFSLSDYNVIISFHNFFWERNHFLSLLPTKPLTDCLKYQCFFLRASLRFIRSNCSMLYLLFEFIRCKSRAKSLTVCFLLPQLAFSNIGFRLRTNYKKVNKTDFTRWRSLTKIDFNNFALTRLRDWRKNIIVSCYQKIFTGNYLN